MKNILVSFLMFSLFFCSVQADSSNRLTEENHLENDFHCYVKQKSLSYEFVFSDISTTYKSTIFEPQSSLSIAPALLIAFWASSADGSTKSVYELGLRYTIELDDADLSIDQILAAQNPVEVTLNDLLETNIQAFRHEGELMYPINLDSQNFVVLQQNGDVVFSIRQADETSFFFNQLPSTVSFLIYWGNKVSRCSTKTKGGRVD